MLKRKLCLLDFSNANVELDTCLIACWHKKSSQASKKEYNLGLTNVHFEKDMTFSACQLLIFSGSSNYNNLLAAHKLELYLVYTTKQALSLRLNLHTTL